MDKINKFLSQLNQKDREAVYLILEKILSKKFPDLRFKKLKNLKNLYSFRMGKIRFICRKEGNNYVLIDLAYRKEVYKNL